MKASVNEQTTETSLPKPGLDMPWLVNSALVTAVAVFLRFYWLGLKPLHHDEGVNGYFLTTLFREGIYKYDPSNYHGPDLYYIALAFTKLFGLNTHSIRWSVAVFGVLTVVLVLFLRRWIGRTGSLAAALFLALSPGMVFISRYFIHEILFVFFSLAILVSILYFIERERAGFFACTWMVILLMVCFLPPALRLPSMMVSGIVLQWVIGIAIFSVEAFLVFLVMRMLLYWNGGRPIYALLAAASFILLFATKETAFITVGTYVIAWVCVRIWQKVCSSSAVRARMGLYLNAFRFGVPLAAVALIYGFFADLSAFYEKYREFFNGPNGPDQNYVFYAIVLLLLSSALTWIILSAGEDGEADEEDENALRSEPSFSKFRKAVGSRLDLILILTAGAFVIIYVGVLFFSSFFTYPYGVIGAFEAYAVWTKTGSTAHTQNGTYAYFRWLMELEAPIVILSVLGTVIAVFKARHRFALFSGIWAFGILLAYTIIPYKTPWLAISIILPMCIAAGYGIERLVRSKDPVLKVMAAVLSAVAVSVLAFQTYDINFVRYDDDRMPYVYAHTRRGFEDLINRVKRIAELTKKKKDVSIDIVSPDYWPMPWYLKDYPNAIFQGGLVDSSKAEIIIGSKTQLSDLESRYGATHRIVGEYPLRPGVELYLLVRKDVKAVE